MTNLGDPDPDARRIRQPNSGCPVSYLPDSGGKGCALKKRHRCREYESLLRVGFKKGARQLQIRVLGTGLNAAALTGKALLVVFASAQLDLDMLLVTHK